MSESLNVSSRRCPATKKSGDPCRAYVVRGTDLCASHSRKVGAPEGNRNRQTHGAYSSSKLTGIDDVVDDLMRKQENLSLYISERIGEMDSEELVKLLSLSAQNASRLGRLLRDQQTLGGSMADGLLQAVNMLMDDINAAGILKVVL